MLNWISGGHVLVIGSETPWIEAMLLELGAANVTTLDYNQVISEVPNIRCVRIQEHCNLEYRSPFF